MDTSNAWAFPEALQPTASEVRFDLQAAFDAVVKVHSEIPEDAFTAGILGTERVGSGVVIREDGLVLTIGYLVTEAESVWLTFNDGSTMAAYPLAYDFSTGFGLLAPLGHPRTAWLSRGTSRSLTPGADAFVIGHGGRDHALRTRLHERREFAGYWEYVLDEALFTVPAHPEWGGTALLNEDGELVGLGSLLVEERDGEEAVAGNMFVPVELLAPILDDLLRQGRAPGPARPWLGMYTTQSDGYLVVTGVAPGGPADQAGVTRGDVVVELAGERMGSLAGMFRKVWRLGAAGVDVPLALARNGSLIRLRVQSGDRNDFLKKPRTH
ncbi:MAG: S1C family serine protease [Burkholderiales bacterium]